MESNKAVATTTITGFLIKICYPIQVRSGFILNVIIHRPNALIPGHTKHQYWKVSIFGKTLEELKEYNKLRGKQLIVECYVNGREINTGGLGPEYTNNLNLKSLKEVSHV